MFFVLLVRQTSKDVSITVLVQCATKVLFCSHDQTYNGAQKSKQKKKSRTQSVKYRYRRQRFLMTLLPDLLDHVGVSKKSVSWTSTFVTMVLQKSGRRSDVTFLVQTFWTPPCGQVRKLSTQSVTSPKRENTDSDRTFLESHAITFSHLMELFLFPPTQQTVSFVRRY